MHTCMYALLSKSMLGMAIHATFFSSYGMMSYNSLSIRYECNVWYLKAVNISIMAKEKQSISIEPLGDRVLVKPLEVKGEARTASGIILPGKDTNEKHERGTIVAAGPGRMSSDGKHIAMEVKKGDVVWFKRGYDAEEVTISGEELVLTSESNILAIEK